MGKNLGNKSVINYVNDLNVREDPFYSSQKFCEDVVAEGSYVYHLDNLHKAYNSCFKSVSNVEKENRFNTVKKLLDKHFVSVFKDEPVESYELKYSEDATSVSLIIRFETIVNSDDYLSGNKSDLFALLFASYHDNFIEVESNKIVKMIFTIDLCDDIQIKEYDKELEELAAKCKVRFSYDLKK